MAAETLEYVISNMSSDIRNFGDYIAKMYQTTFWIDASFLHALGRIFKVDVMLFQAGSDVAFVGENLGQHEPARCVPMIPLALANDRHYWGVVMSQSVSNFEVDHVPKGGDLTVDGSDEEHDTQNSLIELVVPKMMPDTHVQQELDLCLALRDWDPFSEPHDDLLKCLSSISAADDQPAQCTVRQQVLEDIWYEQALLDDLPSRLRYHGACRWRLKKKALIESSSNRRTLALEYLQTKETLMLSTIETDLAVDCSTHSTKPWCLTVDC